MKGMTDNRVSSGLPAGGQFASQNRPEGSPLNAPVQTKGEVLLDASRKALAAAQTLHIEATKTVVAEVILSQYPDAVTAKVGFDHEDGDDAYSYLATIEDADSNELWNYLDGGLETSVDDLVDEIDYRNGNFDIAPYRVERAFDEKLATQILSAEPDDREALVDGATDEQRQGLATHPSADIRHAVAQSPETDVDTLSILIADNDPEVSSAAKFSLYSGDDES